MDELPLVITYSQVASHWRTEINDGSRLLWRLPRYSALFSGPEDHEGIRRMVAEGQDTSTTTFLQEILLILAVYSQFQPEIFNFVFRSKSLRSLTRAAALKPAHQDDASAISDITSGAKSCRRWCGQFSLALVASKESTFRSRLHSHTTVAEAQPEHAGYSAQEDLRSEPEPAAATIAS